MPLLMQRRCLTDLHGCESTVKVGPFARGGKSRTQTKACDHDFKPEATLTPVGIFLPATDELFVYAVTSKVTSDCLVDRLIQWWEAVRDALCPHHHAGDQSG